MSGEARDAQQIQTSVVRVDGQRSVYLPILKQGGDTNTLSVVDGVQKAVRGLTDVPKELVARVVFDQSVFVSKAIENLLHEGGIGLILTGVMILLFLGSVRATVAVFLSIPLSALAAFLAISAMGGTVNTMVLGGLALAFSRLIDNSVVVLENIFRHRELGELPEVAAERGGAEVTLPVLAVDPDDDRGLSSGHFPVWREPVPVRRPVHGGRAVTARVFLRCHDRRAALLRAVPGRRPSRRGPCGHAVVRLGAPFTGSTIGSSACSITTAGLWPGSWRGRS